ncbi:MAG: hypothetical protein J1F22_04610 [Lachnospiraceae bacterium]|nr:hypothetical protein [Lachnospiraceae bacterium]
MMLQDTIQRISIFYLEKYGGVDNAYTEYGRNNKGLILETAIEEPADILKYNLSPYCMDVIRIPVLKSKDGNYVFFGAFIRTSISKDNRVIGSKGSELILASIDENGFLSSNGIYSSGLSIEAPKEIEYHPLSNIKFKGYKIPEWDQLKNIAIDITKQVERAGFIGWDFVFSKDGWVVIEGNPYSEHRSQALIHKGFRPDFENITGLDFKDKYWWEIDSAFSRY